MKEIKDDTNGCPGIHCSWIGRINVVEMTILPKAIYRFNAIPIKLPMAFFTELEQTVLKFVWNHKRLWIVKEILRKKNKAWIHALISNDITVVIKTVWYWHKNRHRSMEHSREPEMNPCIYGQLIFNKGGKNIKWEKVSSASSAGKVGQLHVNQWS